jgi:hypothetical protein
MDFKTLTTTPFIEADNEPVYVDLPQKYKYTYTSTYDPFNAEFCGSFRVADTDRIMKDIHNSFTYQMYIEPYFKIKEVIFNDPATIVYWEDGTKTVVKCGKNDTFDAEKGLALCFMKKALGNKGNFNNTIKEYVK